jgi:hypothetical protein
MYNELKQPEISSNLQTRPSVRQKAAQFTKKTLDDAMKELKTEDTSSNMNKLSQGLLQQKRKVYRENKAVKGLNKRTNISNFGKLGSQTKKVIEVRKNKQMEAAIKNIKLLVR